MEQKPHYRLIVWRRSIDLVKGVYDLTRHLPLDERFSLTNQMRRAAISVASNIAEGAGRKSTGEKLNFFHIARGSLTELDTQVEICEVLGYVKAEERKPLQEQIEVVGRLLYGLIISRQSVETSPH